MKKFLLLALAAFMPSIVHAQATTVTPNVGLLVPGLHSSNWQVPLNYSLNRLDLLLSGNATLPGLDLSGPITLPGPPTSPMQAATKAYVDAQVGSGNALQLQGVSICATAPVSGQIYAYNGTAVCPTTLSASDAQSIQSVAVASKSPFNGEALRYSAANNDYEPMVDPATTIVIAASNSVSGAAANVLCTGTNDDVCINNAISTYCPSATASGSVPGCHVVLEPGIYNLSATASINGDDVWLDGGSSCMWGGYLQIWSGTSSSAGAVGQGCAQLQATTTGFNLVTITGGDSKGSDTSRHRGITISNLYLVGDGYTGIGIYAPNGDDNVHITNNMIQRVATGMNVTLDSPVIEGNTIQDVGADAIDLGASSGSAPGVYARVINNLIRNIGGSGIISQSRDAIASKNVIEDTLGCGIQLNTSGDDNKIEGNAFAGNGLTAVYASNVRSPVVVGNSFNLWSTDVGFNTSANVILSNHSIDFESSVANGVIANNNIDTAFNMTSYAIYANGSYGSVIGNSIHGVWNAGGNPIYMSATTSGAGNSNSGNTTYNHAGDTVQQQGSFATLITPPVTIASSATPALVATNAMQTVTLTANATPTITGIALGTRTTIEIRQDSTGGWTWTWPSSFRGGIAVNTTASTSTRQSFASFDGTTMVATDPGVTGVAQ